MINNRLMTDEQRDCAKAYWLDHLSGEWPRVALPFQKQQTLAFIPLQFRLEAPEELSNKLLNISKHNDLSLFTIVLAAAQSWISLLNEQEDISFTVPVYALTLQESEASNQRLIVRNLLRQEMSFKEVLSLVKQSVSECYRHQLYPLLQLWDTLGHQEPKPIWSALAFAMEGLHHQEHIELLSDGSHEVVFVFDKRAGGVGLSICYNGALYEEEAIREYAQSYLHVIEQILNDPNRSISNSKLITEVQRYQIVDGFNDTKKPYSVEMTIPQLFEIQAAKTMDQVAVISGGIETTYQELNEKVNRLASLLRQIGVGPGTYVAILMDRSIDMIIGVLGILKAGGAYVPLDPAYPKARIETIMTSLTIKYLVSKSSMMRPYQELVWKLQALGDIVYLDVVTEKLESEHVQEEKVRALWDRVLEESYDLVTAGGFTSSYDGLTFKESEVNEYCDRVVSMARAVVGPHSSVLEIGCGSGLISFELAPHVQRYVGIDPSEKVLGRNRMKAKELRLDGAEWISGFAHDMDKLEKESYDLILMASTVQFFPGYAYLEKIVELALRCLKPGGTLLLADIMDLRRKEQFRESLADYKKQIGDEGKTRTNLDRELYCDEAFFYDLQAERTGIAEIEVQHRTEGFQNELGFRYDVIIKKSVECNTTTVRERVKRSWTKVHLELQPSYNINSEITSENEAYVIFTSGSTGTPKGVVVRHKPVVNVIEWVNSSFGIGMDDVLLFLTPLCFDLSVYDIFGTLAAGGTIRIASEEEVGDPERLLRILLSETITVWDSAPAALQQLVPYMRMNKASQVSSDSGLRLVLLSGDWIPLRLPDTMKEHFNGVQVIGMGGATEATIWSNYYPIGTLDPDWASIPYGKPIQNARYYVLSSALEPCPLHVAGELYIGGECLASGYTDPVLTSDRFIPDPFVPDGSSRMYRTGDLAKWMPDGNLIFMGRADNQVKIRGYRIELGEIEVQLLKHEAVKEALVIDRTDRNGHKSLCVYYTTDRELDVHDLKSHAASTLPTYMVPSHYVRLEAIPVTSNGKVDRKRLPDPSEAVSANDFYMAPKTPDEMRLAEIWRKILDTEQVGVTDDFFDLGGDSLQAVQVVAMASEQQIEMTLREILQYRTIREILNYKGELPLMDDLVADEEIAVATDQTLKRRYNVQFHEQETKFPYYYPCFMGAVYSKLTHELAYQIPRSFLPIGDGMGLIAYGYQEEGLPDSRLHFKDYSYYGGFQLSEQFGISSRLVTFDTTAEGLAWCEERLQANELVVMMGTTYYLNYSTDYLCDEEMFLQMIKSREDLVEERDLDTVHAHMFVLIDHTDQGYIVYDSSYNFYGTISEFNFINSFAGIRGLSFAQNDTKLKCRQFGNAAVQIDLDKFKPIAVELLVQELLTRYTNAYLGTYLRNQHEEGLNGYIGLECLKEVTLTLEEAEFGAERVNFTLIMFNNWKYKYIFLRDFLQDAITLTSYTALPSLLKAIEEAIEKLGGWHKQMEAMKEQYSKSSSLDFNSFRMNVVEGFNEMHIVQSDAFHRLMLEMK